jgi:hypothetical protein
VTENSLKYSGAPGLGRKSTFQTPTNACGFNVLLGPVVEAHATSNTDIRIDAAAFIGTVQNVMMVNYETWTSPAFLDKFQIPATGHLWLLTSGPSLKFKPWN